MSEKVGRMAFASDEPRNSEAELVAKQVTWRLHVRTGTESTTKCTNPPPDGRDERHDTRRSKFESRDES